MTQIDASPMPTGKIAAKTTAGVLQDSARDGQGEGDAAMKGGKPRFGDHWRSILSGGGNPQNKGADDPASGEVRAADERSLSPRLASLMRLSSQVFARGGEGTSEIQPAGSGMNPAAAGAEIDISDALGALQEAGPAQDRSSSDPDELQTAQPDAADTGRGNPQPVGPLALAADEARTAAADASAPASSQPGQQASRDAALASANPASHDRSARAPAGRAKPATPASSQPDLHLATRAEAGPIVLKASVTHQATHFAPALGAVNVQALSGAVTELAGDLRQGAERAAPDPASQLPGARPTGPVKTLTIQLTPISLGKVTVEMRLIGGTMQVDIQVADPRALEMVRADKDLIMNLVRKAGIVPDTVTIQTAESASASKQNQTGQGANGSASGREPSRDGSGGNGTREGHDQERMTHDDRSTGQPHLRGDIYL
jgi:chemotaxis protein MotD